MDCIEVMMNEHRNIERMIKVLRVACLNILNEEDINYNDFDLMIKFIKEYADGHHHNKEEKMLFNRMVEYLGPIGEKLIKNGMLVEHDFGRLYVRNMTEALERVKLGQMDSRLDLIGNAVAYVDLLTRHIEKEDEVVYTFAKRKLQTEILTIISNQCDGYEKDNNDVKIENIKLLEKLENKYLK